MKFTVNDKTYFVKWEYQEGLNKTIKQTKVTVCKIYDNSSSYNNPLLEETCVCNPSDNFCKNTGRKISLARALNKLFPNNTTFKGSPKADGTDEYEWTRVNNNEQMKQARAIAWQEYFKESPKRLK